MQTKTFLIAYFRGFIHIRTCKVKFNKTGGVSCIDIQLFVWNYFGCALKFVHFTTVITLERHEFKRTPLYIQIIPFHDYIQQPEAYHQIPSYVCDAHKGIHLLKVFFQQTEFHVLQLKHEYLIPVPFFWQKSNPSVDFVSELSRFGTVTFSFHWTSYF